MGAALSLLAGAVLVRRLFQDVRARESGSTILTTGLLVMLITANTMNLVSSRPSTSSRGELGSHSSRAEVEAWGARVAGAQGKRLSSWGDGGAYFTSPEIAVDGAGLARDWVHIEWFGDSDVLSNRTLIEFDCWKATQKALAWVDYRERGLRMALTSGEDPQAEALPVTPDSPAGEIQRDACRKFAPGGGGTSS
jgi:hypothetical protein